MRWYYKLPLRLRSLFRKYKTELDLSEELQFHLQNQIDENVAQGLDPQEAAVQLSGHSAASSK